MKKTLAKAKRSDVLELDEMRSFVCRRKNKRWVWLAQCRRARQIVACAFNSDNQPMGSGFGYDGAGNPTTDKGQSLAFDPENRMTSYGPAASPAQTDGYDGDGLRAWKQAGASTTRVYFLYDGDRPVIEEAFDGSFQNANTFGPDGLVGRRHGINRSTFYLYDERGNVSQRMLGPRTGHLAPPPRRVGGAASPQSTAPPQSTAVVQTTGLVTSTDSYDAYGTRTSTAAAQPDPWGYGGQAGYYTDVETGLILCTHRFYDPSNGRWLTRDPIGYAGGINLYGYVGNDPVRRNDPSGYDGEGPEKMGVDPSAYNGEGAAKMGPWGNFFSSNPLSPYGLLAIGLQEANAVPGELSLLENPKPSLLNTLRNGGFGILTGVGSVYAGLGAIGGGGLAVGALGSFILAGGLVVAVIGVIAVGFVAYRAYENFLHEDPSEEACI